MKEEWRTIEEFPMYEISDHGRVYSHFHKGRMLKCCDNSFGYMYVTLFNSFGQQPSAVHVLVLEAFDSKRKDKLTCNHKDGDKKNNHISNLEWITHSKNHQHAYATGLKEGLKGKDNPNAVLTEQDIISIRAANSCAKVLSAKYGVSRSHIYNIKNHQKWSHI